LEHDTVGETAHDAVAERQRSAGVEDDAGLAGSAALDDETAQVDRVAGAGIDRDAGAAAGYRNPAKAVALDADRLGDDDRAVAGRIEHIDLAPGRNRIVRVLERSARQCEGARVAVQALRGDEDAGRLRLRGVRDGTEREQRCGESRQCELEHWVALQ